MTTSKNLFCVNKREAFMFIAGLVLGVIIAILLGGSLLGNGSGRAYKSKFWDGQEGFWDGQEGFQETNSSTNFLKIGR